PSASDGIYPTWSRTGTVGQGSLLHPQDGAWHAGLGPNPFHQNEWLISPLFRCPAAAQLSFNTYVYRGSEDLDDYRVLVSADGGESWNLIWSASSLSGGYTDYSHPVIIDLGAWAGQYIQLAWQAVDGPEDDGLRHMWYLDNIILAGSVLNDDGTTPLVKPELLQNYPNPFNPSTSIEYSLIEPALVTISIFNVKGQHIRTLLNEIRGAGKHSVVWDGVDERRNRVSSGIYYYRMQAGKYSSTRKMILMK
ncbi:MAG: choice-of-anchor J domain-containing protein, partial [Candidatus Cloacimonadaceae bacterium]|nr:choice-of-anchor J domain-containing protein [Candidatus Cloacimonadaceae bacterium]